MYSSNRLNIDWCMAASEEKTRKNTHWYDFVKAVTTYYKPTEYNAETLLVKHADAWRNIFEKQHAFCNCVLVEARHYNFKCMSLDCTAKDIAVRDQIIIGLKYSDIHQEALKRS